MNIKILGIGCANCINLAAEATQAAAELGIDAEVTKVTDINVILTYDLPATPGLVIDEKVVASGKPIPTLDQVRELVRAAADPVSATA
ncbi:MAG: thioredoxin family protein [Propionibacteriaceae bacterium]|nr:thioredoxin family protein [Propionibacteriaceae bacterium]